MTESHRLCSPEVRELQNNSQAAICDGSRCSAAVQDGAGHAERLWSELGAGCSGHSCPPFPGGQGWRLLSCPSASTVPLSHVMFQDGHRIPPQKFTGFRKGCVTHITAHYRYHTSQSKISEYFFKVLIHSRITSQIVLHLQLNWAATLTEMVPYIVTPVLADFWCHQVVLRSTGWLGQDRTEAEPRAEQFLSPCGSGSAVPRSLLSVGTVRAAPGFT